MGMTREQAEAEIQRLMALGSTHEKAVADLTEAVRTLQSATVAAPVPATEDGDDLTRYVRDEREMGAHVRGSVRLRSNAETGAVGLLDDPDPQSKWQRRLQKLVTLRSYARIMRRDGDSPKIDRLIAQHVKAAPASVTRIHADISTVGLETVPDLVIPELERALILVQQRRLMGLFPTVQMTGKEYRPPFMSSGLRPYIKGAPASASDNTPAQYTASNLALAQRSISAISLAVRAVLDEDYAEDSIIAMESEIQSALVDALLDGVEDAILNGDTGTHGDTGLASWDIRGRWGSTGLGTAADHRRSWIGLRQAALDVGSSGGAASGASVQTFAGALAMRAAMGVAGYGGAGDVVYITSPEYALKMGQFSELVSAEKVGGTAFNVSGMIGLVGGCPVVISPFMDAQLNASGVFDNSTKTKTGLIAVNSKRWKVYQRKGASAEMQRDITRGAVDLVATWRGNFATLDSNAAGSTNVYYHYNLTP